MRIFFRIWLLLAFVARIGWAAETEIRLPLKPEMLVKEVAWDDPAGLLDEQNAIGDPPKGEAVSPWKVDWRHAKEFPYSVYLDLGMERPLSFVWFYDVHDNGVIGISTGSPGNWKQVTEYRTEAYMKWVKSELDTPTRYLRLTRMSPGAQVAEMALYAYTPDGWSERQKRKQAEALAAEAKRQALTRAEEEARNRPLVDAGSLFGKLPLVDEVDCTKQAPDHQFQEFPQGASTLERILGETFRVVKPRQGEASYLTWRVGTFKMLKPGQAYLLTVEYPEDQPRSMIVMNGGCETSRGFYTGQSVGDALRAKYVWSNPESLRVPLSRRTEVWKQLFYLHDRFPELAFIRGSGVRPLTPEDGFPVTIAQFSQENDPPSRGIAVRKIRLFEVPAPEKLSLKLTPPPEGLPRRHNFWREEMADGVIESAKPQERGIANPLDWYQYKARLMRFLGISTFTKDLLEFGACQHWDSTPGGGHDWVFFSDRHKDLWGKIVKLMGSEGFTVLPYYEYAGSRGYKGLGHQRRAKPLTRDDAYTHISWIEQANADLTDPETLADFKKLLDYTVVRFKGDAGFLGAWIRPRSQLPIGFGDATRARFAQEASQGQAVSRKDLINDKALREKYYEWWRGKRRAFLEAMRDHLHTQGVNPDPIFLYTADASEPGVSFPSWEPKLVTDDPQSWSEWLKLANAGQQRPITPISINDVTREDLYLKALLSPPLDWGKWEPSHASPAADPQNYSSVTGALMTHGFNRAYSVSSPKTMDLFRGLSGLALVRHYSLNENMLFDKGGKDLLGYFVADMERAGPYCMMAEALALANGDVRYLGYLMGNSYNRGFPEYVRDFNAAFLALPALPSKKLEGASGDPEVVVRAIETSNQGTWLAVVNTGFEAKQKVTIKVPATGTIKDAVTGEAQIQAAGRITLDLHPCQLKTLELKPN